MGIDLRWEREDGTSLEAVDDPRSHLAHLVQRADLTGTVCLRFLDPYGDATFNQLQIPVLRAEIEHVMSTEDAPQVRDHLRQILNLVGKASGEAHTYLKFVGD